MPASLAADQNQSPRDLVVMKFGGTSVEDTVAIRRLVQIVHSRTGFRLVVVVSALAKVTDQLLSAAQAAAEGKLDYSTALLTHIRLRHQEIAGELLGSEDYAALHREFDAEFRLLNSALCEVAVARELTPCAQDAVSRFGERFSSKLVAAVLCEHRVDAVHYDAATAIVTDSRHSCATPLWERSYENLSQALQPLLQSARVPVLGGFIASTADGAPSTLGRGGSDLTASLVGAALGAQRVEI
jgi:aspartate kinase